MTYFLLQIIHHPFYQKSFLLKSFLGVLGLFGSYYTQASHEWREIPFLLTHFVHSNDSTYINWRF